MVNSINKNHPENVIATLTDGVMYQYNGFEWIRCDATKTYIDDEWVFTRGIKLHKAYDIAEPSEYVDSDIINGDYLATYKTNWNDLLFSEKLDESTKWSRTEAKLYGTSEERAKPTVLLGKNQVIKMPDCKDTCYNLYTEKSSEEVEHSLYQNIITNADKYYCFSTFVKPNPNKDPTIIALSMFISTYNIGLTCKFNIHDMSGYSNGWKILTNNITYINSDCQTVADSTHVFNNSVAGIQLFTTVLDTGDVEYTFRPFILSKVNCLSPCQLKIMQLDTEGNFKFAEQNVQYGNYFSGGQLEIKKAVYNNQGTEIDIPTRPTRYITTEENKAFKRTLSNIYIYNELTSSWIDNSDKKIYYLNDVVEAHKEVINEQEELIHYTTIDKSKPTIANPQRDDIALVNSLITFTTDKLYKSDEHISGVILGNNFREDDPMYTFYYDEYDRVYKIKVPSDNEEGYEYIEFKTLSEETNKMIITKALIYNQGYFETYYERSNFVPSFSFGFNTGGGCNFWKTHYLKHN